MWWKETISSKLISWKGHTIARLLLGSPTLLGIWGNSDSGSSCFSSGMSSLWECGNMAQTRAVFRNHDHFGRFKKKWAWLCCFKGNPSMGNWCLRSFSLWRPKRTSCKQEQSLCTGGLFNQNWAANRATKFFAIFVANTKIPLPTNISSTKTRWSPCPCGMAVTPIPGFEPETKSASEMPVVKVSTPFGSCGTMTRLTCGFLVHAVQSQTQNLWTTTF